MFSVVQYYFENITREYPCGYCKRHDAYKRHGMWAHALTVQDYQNLIDRGWRRSGSYCYKPINDQTCCPMYTIKCEALNFALTKSQKKVCKKLARFLKDGQKQEDYEEKRSKRSKMYHNHPNDVDFSSIMEQDYAEHAASAEILDKDEMIVDPKYDTRLSTCDESTLSSKNCDESDNTRVQPSIQVNELVDNGFHVVNAIEKSTAAMPRIEGDDSLPRKAKLIRIERAKNRLLAKGKTLDEIQAIYKKKKEKNRAKTLDELLDSVVDGVNKLELKLVRVSSEEFMETLDESVELFRKYQMAVHNEEADECNKKSFLNFLGKTPLQHWNPASGPPQGYGSFHQQYWLNKKLMAVGVIDILPSCVSSVYFFYDPAYSFLSLGTYSSLIEVRLTRELHKSAVDLKYYYMGYYIHNIPKMKYKAKMSPSQLLCPETFKWFNIDQCIIKLNKDKYSRFNDDLDALDEDGIVTSEVLDQVRVYYRGRRLYRDMRFIRHKFGDKKDDSNEVKEYVELVGKKCSHSMYLVRS